MKILITGSAGQLGTSLKDLIGNNEDFLFHDLPEIDITEKNQLSLFVERNNIGMIINCAAYTAVDKAESDKDCAFLVNKKGAAVLASVSKKYNLTLIHISTDYVFNGRGFKPYTEEDRTAPNSVYGKSKREGELAIQRSGCKSIIIRTSWLYSPYGNNFMKTMIRLGKERESINVVNDQVGTPTSAHDLATAILQIIPQLQKTPRYGDIFHYSNEGVCSWYDFARKIMELNSLNCLVHPIDSSMYPAAAARPHYSVLNKELIRSQFGVITPHWESSLKDVLTRLNP